MPGRLWVAAVVGLLAGCSGPYSGLTTAAKDQGKSALVRAQVVTSENIPEVVVATGELLAEDLATISAKVPGRIAKLHVDLGGQVEAGQVLAEIEREDYEFRLKQAEALVEQTRARLGLGAGTGDQVDPARTSTVKLAVGALENARLNFTRTSQLAKEGVASQVDFDTVRSNLLIAEARYQAAMEEVYQNQAQLVERRAQLELARQQLTDTTIRAPFRGAITRRQASVGEYLAVNAAVVSLVRWHPLRLRLEVPERLAAKVRLGQSVGLRVEGSTATRSGRVVRLSPSIEAQNRSLVVEAEIPNEDGALRAGSFAEGTIAVNPDARGVAVPSRAVLSFAGVDRVFVVENGAAAERLVKPGRRLGERVEIVTGLKGGELVITEGHDRIAAGQKVQVAN
ncbi:MAG: efflux RND transporter periplasmic adaptor subunit [Acidobacteria bacterium]|nr:efflux RND transporter periplasmic adaptor subunit [Acidobacteriota bacterium]